MRLALLLVLILLAVPARADIATMCDTTGCLIERKVDPAGFREIDPTLMVSTTTDPTSAGFVWGVYSLLNNRSNANGENVAVYGQAFKHGHGTTWAGVFETQDFDGTNGAWAIEADLAGNGAARPDALRVGVGVIGWRDSAHRFAPYTYTMDYGFWLTPGPGEPVATRYGLRIDMPCTVACVSVKSGQRVCFDDAATICQFYDAATHTLVTVNGDLVIDRLDVTKPRPKQ